MTVNGTAIPEESMPASDVSRSDVAANAADARASLETGIESSTKKLRSFEGISRLMSPDNGFDKTLCESKSDIANFIVEKLSKVSSLDSAQNETLRVFESLQNNVKMDNSQYDRLNQLNENLRHGKPLSASEAALHAALTELNLRDPFDPNDPSTRRDVVGTQSQAEDYSSQIADLKLGQNNLSAQERNFVVLLGMDNLYGSGMSTRQWLDKFNYDEKKVNISSISDILREKGALTPDLSIIAKLSETLPQLANAVTYIQTRGKTVLRQRDAGKSEIDALSESTPLSKIERSLKRQVRRIKFGLDRESAIHPNKALVALAAGIGLFGWLLTSKNTKVEAGRKALLGGILGIGGFFALDFASEAVLGKGAIDKIREITGNSAEEIDENSRKLFWRHAEGTDAQRQDSIDGLEKLMAMTSNVSFNEVWERYQAAKRSDTEPKKLKLDGISEFGHNKNLFVQFYKGMEVFERRYGHEIQKYINEKGKLPFGNVSESFMTVTAFMLANDSENEVETSVLHKAESVLLHTGEWAGNLGKKAWNRTKHTYETLISGDNKLLESYLEDIFPKKEYGDVDIDWKENVLTLPGGITTTFDFVYGDEVQKVQPGKEVNGFRLKLPILENGNENNIYETFYFDGSKQSLLDFCEKLIVNTASIRRTKSYSHPDIKPENLEFDKFHKLWRLHNNQLPTKTFSVKNNQIKISPTEKTDLFLNPSGRTLETFDFTYFDADTYAKSIDKKSVPSESYDSITSHLYEKLLVSYLCENLSEGSTPEYFFEASDITITNWDQMYAGQTFDQINAYATVRGKQLGINYDFDKKTFVVNDDQKTVDEFYSAKTDEVVDQLKDLLKKLPEDWKGYFMGLVKGGTLQTPVTDGFIDEFVNGISDQSLKHEANIIKTLLNDKSTNVHSSGPFKDLTKNKEGVKRLRSLIDVKNTITDYVLSGNKLGQEDGRRLRGMLALPGIKDQYLIDSYMQSINYLDDQLRFDTAETKANLFELIRAEIYSMDPSIDSAHEKHVLYMFNFTREILNQLRMSDSIGRIRRVTSDDVVKLQNFISNTRTTSKDDASKKFSEFPSYEMFASPSDKPKIDFINRIYQVEDYISVLLSNVDLIDWESKEFDLLEAPAGGGTKTPKPREYYLIPQENKDGDPKPPIKIPIPDFSFLDGLFSPSQWNIVPTIVSMLGFETPDKISLPNPFTISVNDNLENQKLLAEYTEDYIRQHINDSNLPSDIEKITKQFSDHFFEEDGLVTKEIKKRPRGRSSSAKKGSKTS